MSGQDGVSEKRKWARLDASGDVSYRVIHPQPSTVKYHEGFVRNFSGGGMCIATGEKIAPGALIAVEASLAYFQVPLAYLGRVAWCDPGPEPGQFLVGIEFWWVGWGGRDAQDEIAARIAEALGSPTRSEP
jgi:PilZ domain-containing protein